jgi:hypothetical protein
MSIQSEAERIKANVAATYAAAAELGAEMPDAQNSDDLAKTVADAKAVLYKPQTLTDAQKTQARTNIDSAPSYTYGTTDLTAGSSALATGKLYFKFK